MVIKRNYIIPLRREFQKAPKYKRAKKAVTGLIEFLSKHMKSDTIKIGKHLNEKIWEKGIKNPPAKVEIVAIKNDEGVVKAELIAFEKEIEEKKTAKVKTQESKTSSDKAKPVEKAAVTEKLEDAIEKESPKAEKKSE